MQEHSMLQHTPRTAESPFTLLLLLLLQVCSVIIAPEGLWLRWEDDSKTLQSSVQLRSEVNVLW
jgi:hypothetical protein